MLGSPSERLRSARVLTESAFWLPLLLAGATVAVFPPHTVDGPAHLLGGDVIARHGDVAVFGEYYRLDWFPTPNLSTSLLLAGLIRLFGPDAAAHTVLVACVVALPLGLRYAITALRPECGWAGIAALPLAFNYLYVYGFHNFCLATALCLGAAGVALRAAPAWTPTRTVALGVLLTATWFTHLLGFVAALVLLGAVVVAIRPRRLLPPALTTAPGLGLTGAYLVHGSGSGAPHWAGPFGALGGLISLHTPLVTWTRADNVVAGALAAVLFAIAVATRRAAPPAEAVESIALAACAAVGLFLLAPEDLGTAFGFIGERLSVFPILFGLLWLLARPIPTRWAAAAVGACLVATAALGAVRLPELRREDRLAAEYVSAAKFLRPGSTLIALRFAEFTPSAGRNPHADPLRHLSSELAVRSASIDVGHYEAVFDYFPARFRPDRDLRRAVDPTLTGLEQVPPRVDLDGARRLTGAPIAFVLLVGVDRATGAAAPALAATRAALANGYRLVGHTAPRGLVEVWAAA